MKLEWKLLERFSRSEVKVKVQGHEQTECYSF